MEGIPCSSGPETLALLRTGARFDAGILDIQMPDMDGYQLAHAIREQPSFERLPLIAFSSVGQRRAETEAAGFTSSFAKPIKPAQLIHALAEVFVGAPVRIRDTASVSEFDPTLGKRYPLRILLAEDLVVNQKLMIAMLGKMGYRTDVAANGLEVLEALERQQYDIVLMDMQLPERDGLEASRQSQSRWPAEGRPRIVALTANAMREDREACVAAGMEDYLAKPVRLRELVNALVRAGEIVIARTGRKEPEAESREQDAPDPTRAADTGPHDAPSTVPDPSHAPPQPGSAPSGMPVPTAQFVLSPSEPVLDEVMRAQYREMREGGMPEMVGELLAAFQGDADRLLPAIGAAVAAGDAATLRSAAHGMKGAAGNLGGRRLAAVCYELEKRGRDNRLEGAKTLAPLVEPEYQALIAALREESGSAAVPSPEAAVTSGATPASAAMAPGAPQTPAASAAEHEASSEKRELPGISPPQSPVQASQPVLDEGMRAQYREMREGGMPELVGELLAAFRSDAERLLGEIERAVHAGDAAALRSSAHGIKGAAGNLGGLRLHSLCYELECMGRDGRLEHAPALLPHLLPEYEALVAALGAEASGNAVAIPGEGTPRTEAQVSSADTGIGGGPQTDTAVRGNPPVVAPPSALETSNAVFAPDMAGQIEMLAESGMLPELIEALETDIRSGLHKAIAAIVAGEPAALAEAAHGILGAAGNLGGAALADRARALEEHAGRRGTDGAEGLLSSLELEYARLDSALRAMAEGKE